MADAKISALTATATLADTDELAVASSGASKKITGANLKASVIADATNATQAELDAHVNDTSAAHAASAISADSSTLVGTGTDVQAVFEELDNAIVAAEAATAAHLADTSAAHAASAISADSTTLVGTGTDVQAVLEELDNGIADHLADTSAAHAASAVSADSTTLVGTGTDVQAVLEELDNAIVATETVANAAVAKALYDANTVLAADSDNTPAALTMGASTILARLAAGNIKAATPAELRTLLALVIGTNVQAWDADLDVIAALADPNADRLLFWDDSAGAYAYLTAGTGLTIAGTTITASGGGTTILNYTTFTSNVTVSATSDATANTVVTAGAFTPDGSTLVCIEFYSPCVVTSPASSSIVVLNLYDGSTDIGRLHLLGTEANASHENGVFVRHYLTPTNASHTYSVRAWSTSVASGNASVQGGAGGAGTNLPGYIRITSGT